MTFGTWLTVGWAVQLPITQCGWQSHLPSETVCTVLNDPYS